MRYLLTHSLLSSWLYAMKDVPGDRDLYQEFLQVLRREPTPRTEAMQNGIDFEDLVTAITLGKGDEASPWYPAARKVAEKVQGGILQCKASRPMEVDGVPILLYGRLDCLKGGVISDIKFSPGYERGKYIGSTQHPTYFEIVPEARVFQYLISNGSEVWTETYRRDETPSIGPTIGQFFQFLRGAGLMETYEERWQSIGSH